MVIRAGLVPCRRVREPEVRMVELVSVVDKSPRVDSRYFASTEQPATGGKCKLSRLFRKVLNGRKNSGSHTEYRAFSIDLCCVFVLFFARLPSSERAIMRR